MSPKLPTVAEFVSDPFLDAVQRTLMNDVKAALKAPLMQMAEAEVDSAVDKASQALQVKVRAYIDDYRFTNRLEVSITKPEKSTISTPSE